MKKFGLWVLLGGLLLTAGCQNTVNRVENADRTMTPTVINDRRFVTDGYLADRLKLTGISTATTKDGLLRVQVMVLNSRVGFFSQMWSGLTGENPYRIKYRFAWFDRNGMAMDSIVSTWKEMTIVPGDQMAIQSVAPNGDCKDFSLSVKEAD